MRRLSANKQLQRTVMDKVPSHKGQRAAADPRARRRSMTTRTASLLILVAAIVGQAQAQGRRPTEPAAVTVSIGGEEITLHPREPLLIPGSLDLLNRKIDSMQGGFFEPLVDAARSGNEAAAYNLYDSLETCKSFPKSRAEFDATMEKGRKSFAETGSAPTDGPPLALGMDWDKWSHDLEHFFHKCDGVTDDMYATATELVRESVGRGSDVNRNFYAKAIAKTAPQEAHEQFEILWRKGYLTGLKGLAVNSTPHRIAAIVAMADLVQAEPGATQTQLLQWREWRDQQLSKLEASMGRSAFQEASKEAAQILKNPNCCWLDD